MTEEKKPSVLDRWADLKADLELVRQRYLTLVHVAPQRDVDAASAEVKRLQQAISETLTEGARPCKCGHRPHGMHQAEGDHPGFEVGCLHCHPFKFGGETVCPRVRGALLPQHAVEAWNEGPVAWMRKFQKKPTG